MIRHKAKIVDNNDPEKKGRVKFASHTLLGGKVHPEWAEPMFAFAGNDSGWFFIPEVDQIVEISFDDEKNMSQPRWISALYSDAGAVPAEAQENYPDVRLIKTPSGHGLLFDDSPGNEKIELFHKTGACISIDNSGNIEFKSKGKIIFDATQIELGKGATQKIILGDQLLTQLNAHTHPASPSATGPPAAPLAPALLSTVVKVK